MRQLDGVGFAPPVDGLEHAGQKSPAHDNLDRYFDAANGRRQFHHFAINDAQSILAGLVGADTAAIFTWPITADCFSQGDNPKNCRKAEQAAVKPGLRFEFHDTGQGAYESFLASLREPAD